jgi:precorrin-2 methylase
MSRTVTVKALKRFNQYEVGDVFQATMNESLAHLIVEHYLEFVEDPGWQRSDLARSPSGRFLAA